jgi:anti-anti-sigma regulatory factor
MKDGNLLIAHNKDSFEIKVSGRANFEYGVPLRTFAQSLDQQHIKHLSINLADCLGMDSTFMGVLTMLALKLKRANITIEILNISEQNHELLHALGIHKLFSFANKTEQTELTPFEIEQAQNSQLDTAKTVFEAHDTLMQADKDNIKKFEQVTKFAREDAERLTKNAAKN